MAIINGTSGRDILLSTNEDDEIDGKEDRDLVSYADATAPTGVVVSLKLQGYHQHTGGGFDLLNSIEGIIGSSQGDFLEGDFRTNFLYGGDGGDSLFGAAGNDRLYGENGDDRLIGGAGDDFMRGGAGNDFYYVEDAGDVVEEWWANGQGGIDMVETAISYILPAHVENLTLALAAAAIDGTGNASRNSMIGNASANSLYGLAGDDTLEGGLGDDVIDGGDGFDIVSYEHATSGIWTLLWDQGYAQDYGQGNDTLISIEGLIGSEYGDDVVGGPGYSVLWGLGGNDYLELWADGYGEVHGGTGHDTVNGGSGDDVLYGDEGDDSLGGFAGNDRMYGGAGNDSYEVRQYGDKVIENPGEGWDWVVTTISYTLPDNVEGALLIGNGSLTGNDLDNVLRVELPHYGIVDFHGGGGADIFSFNTNFGVGRMRIDDFTSGEDKIDLSNIFYDGFAFRGDAGRSGNGDQIWTTQSGDTTILHAVFGGREQFTIWLQDLATPVTAGDFII